MFFGVEDDLSRGLLEALRPNASLFITFLRLNWDAMTRESPFRRALTQVEAVAEVQRCAGSQFDPEVVAALVDEVATQPVVAAAC